MDPLQEPDDNNNGHRVDAGSGVDTASAAEQPPAAAGTIPRINTPAVSVHPPAQHPLPVLPPLHLPQPHLPPPPHRPLTLLHPQPHHYQQPGPFAFPVNIPQPHLFPHGHEPQQHHQNYIHPHPAAALISPYSSYNHPAPPTWTLPPGHPFLPQCLKFHLVPWLFPELASAESGANVVENPNDAHLIIINPSLANRHHIPPLNALPSVRNGTARIVPYDWFFRSHYSRISSDIERSLLFVDARQDPLLVALAKGLQADSSSTRMQLVTLIQDNGGIVVTPKSCQIYIVEKPDSEQAIEKARQDGCSANVERKSLEWVIERWDKSLVTPFRPPRPGDAAVRAPPQPRPSLGPRLVKVRKGSKAPRPGESAGRKAESVPAPLQKRKILHTESDRPEKTRKVSSLPTPYTKLEEAEGMSPYTPGTAAFFKGLPNMDSDVNGEEGKARSEDVGTIQVLKLD